MSKDLQSVLLDEDQIECVRSSLSSLARKLRDQRYDPTDADRVRRQRADEEMIDSVKKALREAKPAA